MQTNINDNIHTAEPNEFTQALEDKMSLDEAVQKITQSLELLNQKISGVKFIFIEFLNDHYPEYLKNKQEEAAKYMESLNRNTAMETNKI